MIKKASYACVLICLKMQLVFGCQSLYRPFSTESDWSDLIFKGVVLSGLNIENGQVQYKLKAEIIWKGLHYDTISIKTNYGGPACGFLFGIGEEYIVYVKNFETGSCTRTREVRQSSDTPRLNFKYKFFYRQIAVNDTSALLTNFESEFFNSIFHDYIWVNHLHHYNRLNFANKKIAFYYHDSFISKGDYFENFANLDPDLYFEPLSNAEKGKTGYDAIMFIDKSKRLSVHQRRKILKHLKPIK